MTAIVVTLRDLIKDEIEATRVAGNFVFNEFETTEAYAPNYERSGFPDDGRVTLIALAKDDVIRTRGNTFTSECPVQVAFQRPVDPSDITTMNTMIELCEQIRKAVKNSIPEDQPYPVPAWVRNEAMRDPNGTPYHYNFLHDSSLFMSVFTAYFQVTEKGD